MVNSPSKHAPTTVNSPSKHTPTMPQPASTSTTHHLSSPRSTRSLRKLQSAHALSSQYAALNHPSLISQQRQQQQQQRNTSSSQIPPLPPLPPLGSHHRARSNSDAASPAPFQGGNGTAKRSLVPKKPVVVHSPREELEALVRQGPKGDVPTGLQRLRHLILCDGLDADNDGMVSLCITECVLFYTGSKYMLTIIIVSDAHLHLAHTP